MSARAWNVLACLAALYLLVMALAGEQMRQAQFVAFEAAGLLAEDPATVTALSLGRGETRRHLVRGDGGWRRDEAALPDALQPRVGLAVKFLHTAKPVRRMPAASMEDAAAGGFDADALTVTATDGKGRDFTFTLGATTPEGSLQYLRVAGDDHVYLMSRFVGEEWEAVWAGLR